jgi:antitoxin (DNA-binding transcriptional repressor) of toxin-antitoxin stability system
MTLSETTFDAEEKIADLLNHAKSGETVVITRAGIPVAKLSLLESEIESALEAVIDREAVKEALFKRLRSQPNLNLPRFTRDEIYSDDF